MMMMIGLNYKISSFDPTSKLLIKQMDQSVDNELLEEIQAVEAYHEKLTELQPSKGHRDLALIGSQP